MRRWRGWATGRGGARCAEATCSSVELGLTHPSAQSEAVPLLPDASVPVATLPPVAVLIQVHEVPLLQPSPYESYMFNV